MGFFDDIVIPADAMQHPTRLYPLLYYLLVMGRKKPTVIKT